MTDRELLELAAKAVGIKKDDSPYNGGGHGNTGFSLNGDMVLDWHNNERWNPLTDDGDALRLAVKLGLDILLQPRIKSAGAEGETTVFGPFKGESWQSDRYVEAHGTDPYAATRRAIVRAAAEIGKEMK
jgi:hypothetical protein